MRQEAREHGADPLQAGLAERCLQLASFLDLFIHRSLTLPGSWFAPRSMQDRLLLTADAPVVMEADHLREQLIALEAMQALAAWLERRSQLGHNGFARVVR